MRTCIDGLAGGLVVVLAAMMAGCASGGGAKSGAPSGAQTGKAADTKACVMQFGGHDVLRVMVPADAVCTPKDGSLHLVSHDRYVDFWLVRGAKTVDEAASHAGGEITSEFKEFKATSTTALTIAGSSAKRLMGSGTEADDGDPGTADLIVFKIGGRIFVACTHGEAISHAAQQWMLTVVQSAQAP